VISKRWHSNISVFIFLFTLINLIIAPIAYSLDQTQETYNTSASAQDLISQGSFSKIIPNQKADIYTKQEKEPLFGYADCNNLVGCTGLNNYNYPLIKTPNLIRNGGFDVNPEIALNNNCPTALAERCINNSYKSGYNWSVDCVNGSQNCTWGSITTYDWSCSPSDRSMQSCIIDNQSSKTGLADGDNVMTLTKIHDDVTPNATWYGGTAIHTSSSIHVGSGKTYTAKAKMRTIAGRSKTLGVNQTYINMYLVHRLRDMYSEPDDWIQGCISNKIIYGTWTDVTCTFLASETHDDVYLEIQVPNASTVEPTSIQIDNVSLYEGNCQTFPFSNYFTQYFDTNSRFCCGDDYYGMGDDYEYLIQGTGDYSLSSYCTPNTCTIGTDCGTNICKNDEVMARQFSVCSRKWNATGDFTGINCTGNDYPGPNRTSFDNTALKKCCGVDPNPNETTKIACIAPNGSCVWRTSIDSNNDGKKDAFCAVWSSYYPGQWVDCDDAENRCEPSNTGCGYPNAWVEAGELKPWGLGEYDFWMLNRTNNNQTAKPECCGDDAGEYLVLSGNTTTGTQNIYTCCDNKNATGANLSGDECAINGICKDRVPTTEICDGIDNNCDGVIDENGSALCDDNISCTIDTCNGAAGCSHTANNSLCSSGACGKDVCVVGAGGGCQNITPYNSSTTVCRPSKGTCDIPENCTGDSTDCPSDGFLQDTFNITYHNKVSQCGDCQYCDGISANCTNTILNGDWFHECTKPCQKSLTCNSGKCALANSSTVCNLSTSLCEQNATCNGINSTCPSKTLSLAGTLCRASAGACDVAETCTGLSGSCPTDVFMPANTVCDNSTGPCETNGTCSGTSATCSAKSFLNGDICRASSGLCDVAETCNGVNGTCPTNVFLPANTVCDNSSGPCQTNGTCSGASATCSAKTFLSSSTVCRAVNGICDIAETCNGTGAACPSDAFLPNNTVCDNSSGPCQTNGTCSGTNASCSVKMLMSGGVCRPSAGACDIEEQCGGYGADCPLDVFKTISTVCNPSSGVCENNATCSGSSAICPSKTFMNNQTACRAFHLFGSCDPGANCSGSTASCPETILSGKQSCGLCSQCNGTDWNCTNIGSGSDPFNECTFVSNSSNCTGDACNGLGACNFNSGGICRDDAGDCDIAESCNGSSYLCPNDVFKNSSNMCRGSAGGCDIEEYCIYNNATCPADQFLPNGTICANSTGPCETNGTCSGTNASCSVKMLMSGGVCRASTGQCDAEEQCGGYGAACPPDLNATEGNSCNLSLFCTINDQCIFGTCIGQPRNVDDNESCTIDYCNETSDTVTHTPIDNDNDGFSICNNSDCNDANAAINPSATEICTNKIDDNCNNEADYDTNNTGNLHGDVACPVDVLNINVQNKVVENSNFIVLCKLSSTEEVNSAMASIDGVPCVFEKYNPGIVAQFQCYSGSFSIVGKDVKCFIDLNKSYSNTNQSLSSANIIVTASNCTKYSQTDCEADPDCDFCPQCNNPSSPFQYNGNPLAPGVCVNAGLCSHACYAGATNACGAQCDAGTSCPITKCPDSCSLTGNDMLLNNDVPNSCTGSCTCENNACAAPTVVPCGSNACTFNNTVGSCTIPCVDLAGNLSCGTCTPEFMTDCQCAPGWVDANGNSADGCEYSCTPTNSIDVCGNMIDDNCDGHIDEGCCGNTIIDNSSEICESTVNKTMPWTDKNNINCSNPGNVSITSITINNVTMANITGFCNYTDHSFYYTDMYGDCSDCGCISDPYNISQSNDTAPANTSLYCELCDSSLDNITNCGECKIKSAYWSQNKSLEGDGVLLIVETENCDGYDFNFKIFEDDSVDILPSADDPANVNPSSAVSAGNFVHTNWTAEWQNDCAGWCNPPEYYFIATAANNTNLTVRSGLMNVYRSNFNGTVTLSSDRQGYYCYPQCTAYVNITNNDPYLDGKMPVIFRNTDDSGALSYNVSLFINDNFAELPSTNGEVSIQEADFYTNQTYSTRESISLQNATSAKWNITLLVNGSSYNLDPYIDSIELLSPADGLMTSANITNFSYVVYTETIPHNCTLYLNGNAVNNTQAANGTENNISIENLTNGAYSWYVYCINPFGESGNTTTRMFGILPYCGDGTCTETCDLCPQDCGSCPITPPSGGGGGGGNGNGALTVCDWNYICSDWSECLPNCTQTRKCLDSNDCEAFYARQARISGQKLFVQTRKPVEMRNCECKIEPVLAEEKNVSIEGTVGINAISSEGRILSLSELSFEIANDKSEDLKDIEVKLTVPSGWEYELGDIQSSLSGGSSIDVNAKLLIPYTEKEANDIKIEVTSGGKAIAEKTISYKTDIPEFLVAVEPSFDGKLKSRQPKIYYIINNKGDQDIKGAEIEMNINKGKQTKIVDFMSSYSVLKGSVFSISKEYDLSKLPEGTYELNGKLSIFGFIKKENSEQLLI